MSLFNTNGLVDAIAYGTLNEILGIPIVKMVCLDQIVMK